jgi:hypothetical protein
MTEDGEGGAFGEEDCEILGKLTNKAASLKME